jgi:hypothetical protein
MHFEKLGIGSSGSVDTLNNAFYINSCLGAVQIDNDDFNASGNPRNAIVTDALTSGATVLVGPNNSFGAYTKGYDGSLETGTSSGSVWILDDFNHLAASAIVQNTGNVGAFFWTGGQYFKQLLRFSNIEFNMNGGASPSLIRMDTTNGSGFTKAIKNDGNVLGFQGSGLSNLTTMDDSGNWIFSLGVSVNTLTNNKGVQSLNTTTTCTTGASAGAQCTTAAISLPVAYSDTNYRIGCEGVGAFTNIPVITAITKSNSSFTITVTAITAAAASFGAFDCWAMHN